ncbi:MAG: hypothetical protein AB1509_02150 [Chloroflexota bacterium]
MNAEIFAEWLRRQGHTVIKTQSSYWAEFGPRVFQAFPYHWLIEPSEDELVGLLKEHRALGLRYSSPFSAGEGAASYHAVYEGKGYGYETLGKWSRKNVRRGLSHCRVEPISFERLAEEGFDLQVDTLARQGRKLHLEKQTWHTRCLSARDLPGFDAWGALVNGRLAASVITFQMGEWGYMLYQQCHRDFLAEHVNNALSFVVTCALLERPETRAILYGLHSLDAPPSVDEFKFRMGYTAKPVRQRVVFHPWLRPFMNRASHTLLKAGLRLKPGHPALSKAEGMLRFYLQGRLPLEKQSLPPPLLSN